MTTKILNYKVKFSRDGHFKVLLIILVLKIIKIMCSSLNKNFKNHLILKLRKFSSFYNNISPRQSKNDPNNLH